MQHEVFLKYADYYDNPFDALMNYRGDRQFSIRTMDYKLEFYKSIPESFIERCVDWVSRTDQTDPMALTHMIDQLRLFIEYRDNQQLKDALVHAKMITSIRKGPTYEQCL